MGDLRSRRTLVVEERFFRDGPVKERVADGFGVVLVPDLSALSSSSADRFLTVTADQVEEFLKDGQEVVILEKRGARWMRLLDERLAARGLSVKRVNLA